MIGILILPVLAILLGILGISGLVKKKIKISANRELLGVPLVILSIFYIVVAVAALVMMQYYSGYIIIGFPLLAIIVGIVTLISVLSFGRSKGNF